MQKIPASKHLENQWKTPVQCTIDHKIAPINLLRLSWSCPLFSAQALMATGCLKFSLSTADSTGRGSAVCLKARGTRCRRKSTVRTAVTAVMKPKIPETTVCFTEPPGGWPSDFCEWWQKFMTHTSIFIIYIYICVCVCVCMCIYRERERDR